MDYQKQAQDFLTKYNAKITITRAENQGAPLWANENEKYGYKYNITIERENKKPYKFNFWDSIYNKEQENNAKTLLSGKTLTVKPFYGKPFEIKRECFNFIGRGDYPQNLNKYGNNLINDYKSDKFLPSAYDVLACLTKSDPEYLENFCYNMGYDIDSKKAEKIFLAVNKEWHSVNAIFGDVMEELAEIN